MSWSFIGWSFKNLTWYQYGWAMLPVALAAVGGLVGGLCAAGAISCNLYLMRSKLRPVLRYTLAGLTTSAAVGVYYTVAIQIGISVITADSIDRDLQKRPTFVALKKADPAGYAKLLDQFSGVKTRAPANIQAAVQQTLAAAISNHAPHASDQAVIDRARALALEIDQIGAQNADACFAFLYPGLAPAAAWKQYISPEVAKFDATTTILVLETGSANPQPVPERAEISESLNHVRQQLVAQYGEDAIVTFGHPTASADHTRFCSMNGSFYKEALSLPRKQAVPLLRFLFAQHNSA